MKGETYVTRRHRGTRISYVVRACLAEPAWRLPLRSEYDYRRVRKRVGHWNTTDGPGGGWRNRRVGSVSRLVEHRNRICEGISRRFCGGKCSGGWVVPTNTTLNKRESRNGGQFRA